MGMQHEHKSELKIDIAAEQGFKAFLIKSKERHELKKGKGRNRSHLSCNVLLRLFLETCPVQQNAMKHTLRKVRT